MASILPSSVLVSLSRFLFASSPKPHTTSLVPPPYSNLVDFTVSTAPLSIGVREQVYQVLEILPGGATSPKSVCRRQLLKWSGLRLRDLRSVDPSLSLINSSPSLLVRDHALLLNFGSLRAIVMADRVFLFDHYCRAASAFLCILLPRLSGAAMPFELEVIEAALISQIQFLEQRLMAVKPRVAQLLGLLPNRPAADVLEELRLSKQTLVELGSRARALKQMLLGLLEDPQEIRRICLVGRTGCVLRGGDDVRIDMEDAGERQVAEEEEEEIEMLLENYLQRCVQCHGLAERLLDSAREMDDSMAFSLSSRSLEVSRVELLLQMGTLCVAVGALSAGVFGMNLKSYLEEYVFAIWLMTAGILVSAWATFFVLYYYLRARKIL